MGHNEIFTGFVRFHVAIWRFLSRFFVYVIAPLAVGIVVFYLLASWRPTAYDPPELNQAQKVSAAKRFVAHIAQFSQFGETGEPYWWVLTEEHANEYLAAIDEIAFQQPNRKNEPRRRGDVHDMMVRAGLADPVMRFNDGRVTVMVRSDRFGKIVSADLSFTFVDDGKVLVNLESARIGVLPVPRFAVKDRLKQFRDELQDRADKLQTQEEQAGGRGIPGMVDLAEIFATIMAAVDADPLPAQIKVMRAEVKQIVVEDGVLKLLLSPYYEDD